MAYTVKVEQYISTETVVYDEDGNEVHRQENFDGYWYDTQDSYEITDEEYEEEYA